MVIDSSNINNTNIHLSSYRNSLKTKRTMTYDFGNTDPYLERGKKIWRVSTNTTGATSEAEMHTLYPVVGVALFILSSYLCSQFKFCVLLDTTLRAKVCQ